MRYYCYGCLSNFTLTKEWSNYQDNYCPVCGNGELYEPIPEYETPAQYKYRTGQELSDNSAVWYLSHYTAEWELYYYSEAKDRSGTIVIVNGANPPPDDWREV